MAPHKAATAATTAAGAPASTAIATPSPASPAVERPVVPTAIREYFLPPKQAVGDGNRLVYRPAILGAARLHYVRVSAGLDAYLDLALLAAAPDGHPDLDWQEADALPTDIQPDRDPAAAASFTEVPAEALSPKNFTAWESALKNHLYQTREITIYRCRELKETSRAAETEGEFRGRIGHAVHERRDREAAGLRRRYESKFQTLRDRIRRAEDRVDRERQQLGHQKLNTAISVGATLIGALMGRKLTSSRNIGRATTAMRGAGRATKEKLDIASAEQELAAQQQKLLDLEEEFSREVDSLQASLDPASIPLESLLVRPRKSDIALTSFGLAWVPWRVTPDGIAEPIHTRG
jgi:hypothetical protein